MENVNLYTDGACSGNPGPGGYCAILQLGEHIKYISGSENPTTNNRMELRAVIEGLNALKRPCCVKVVSDSKYVCDAINSNWLSSWKKKNWKKRCFLLPGRRNVCLLFPIPRIMESGKKLKSIGGPMDSGALPCGRCSR